MIQMERVGVPGAANGLAMTLLRLPTDDQP